MSGQIRSNRKFSVKCAKFGECDRIRYWYRGKPLAYKRLTQLLRIAFPVVVIQLIKIWEWNVNFAFQIHIVSNFKPSLSQIRVFLNWTGSSSPRISSKNWALLQKGFYNMSWSLNDFGDLRKIPHTYLLFVIVMTRQSRTKFGKKIKKQFYDAKFLQMK